MFPATEDEHAGFGTWRDLAVGVNPMWTMPEWADGAADQPGDYGEPIVTRLDGPWGIPWFDGQENVTTEPGLPFRESPNPTYPDESVGALPVVGAYEGAFRTHGPVRAWGLEPSGGLSGDQAMARIMRFPANIPERYDPNGVWNTDFHDELAASVAANDYSPIPDSDVVSSLLVWPSTGNYS